MSSRTFFVSCVGNDEYVIRIFRHFSEAIFENELYIREQLKANNLNTNYLLRAPDGDYVYNDAGVLSVMSRRISGKHLEYPIQTRMCFEFGRTLALFHRALTHLPNKNPRMLLTDLDESDVALDEIEEGIFKESVERLLFVTSPILKEDLPRGIMHGDFHADNLLVDAPDIFILDFERSGEGRLILDIARSVADICRVGNKLDKGRMAEFVAGYESVRQLTDTERAVLNKAVGFSAVLIATRIMKYGHAEFAQTFVNISKNALEIDGIIV